MKNIDVNAAVEIYYSTFVISARDIRRIYGCGATCAAKLKKHAAQYAIDQGITLPSTNEVPTRTAFESWGFDIKDLEERARKLATLRKRAAN